MKVKPLRDSDVLRLLDLDCVHAPTKSASTYTSTPFSNSGFSMVPLSLFVHRYFAILLIACPCARLGLLAYFAH